MATLLRVQVELQNDTALPENASVNVLHFLTPETDPTDAVGGITDALEAFYNTLEGLLGSSLNGNASLKFYDLLDPQPRSPIDTRTFTFSPDTGDAFPNECAIVLSIAGLPVSGVPIGRRRGRVYIGPIADGAGITAGGDTFVTSAARDTVALAGQQLAQAGSDLTWTWVVFSPTIAGPQPWTLGELVDASTPITNGWVNNAFDTQRSRGLGDNARTLWEA